LKEKVFIPLSFNFLYYAHVPLNSVRRALVVRAPQFVSTWSVLEAGL